MLCDKCRRREANVHVTQIVNGVRYEQNLCAECAREQAQGINNTFSAGASSGMGRIFEVLQRLGIIGVVVAPDMTTETLHGAEVNLEELGLTLPGSDVSGEGSTTSAEQDVLALKAELNSAVAHENFERAAELRDEIYHLEHTEKGQA